MVDTDLNIFNEDRKEAIETIAKLMVKYDIKVEVMATRSNITGRLILDNGMFDRLFIGGYVLFRKKGNI